jgi:hypothetical protein
VRFMTTANLKAGLTRAEIEEGLGKPGEVKYLQNSFRPPRAGEEAAEYQRELRVWEEKTTGEIWIYEQPHRSLSVSKAGKLLSWTED